MQYFQLVFFFIFLAMSFLLIGQVAFGQESIDNQSIL